MRSSAAARRIRVVKQTLPLVPFLLVLVAAGCHGGPGTPVFPDVHDQRLIATLEAQSETSGTFVALDNPEASSGDRFRANTDPSSGVNQMVGSLQGRAGAVTEFTVPKLPRTYYLNLSGPVFGTIFISNNLAQTASASARSLENGVIRIELLMGERLVGGVDHAYNLAGSSGPWAAMHFYFRPEVQNLTAGSPFTVRLTRMSGLSDFWIGTGGTHQSFVEFRYYGTDPLAGALYLERGRFVPSSGSAEDVDSFLARAQRFADHGGLDAAPPGLVRLPREDSSASAAPLVALGALGLAPLLAVTVRPGRRGGRSLLLALPLLLAAVGGCLGENQAAAGEPDSDPDAPRPTVNATYEEPVDLKDAGHGAIQGRIQDETGLTVAKAHVSLLGTRLFTRTDNAGEFGFPNVTAGTYTMRIDADRYVPLEEQITVQAAKVLRLNITVVFPEAKQQNDKPHLHSVWGDQTRLFIDDTTFTPYTCELGTTCTAGPRGSSTNNWACPGADQTLRCETPIPTDFTKTIPPGTGIVEVQLKWTASGSTPTQLGLRIQSPGNDSADQFYLPRAPGRPFHVAIFPNEADPGHQTFTNWQFWLYTPSTELLAPSGGLVYAGTRVTIEIYAHKSVVPFEPAHVDFWGTNQTLGIINGRNVDYTCAGCHLPSASPNEYSAAPDSGAFVPPGTKEVRGTMRWSNYLNAALPPAPIEWNVWYKPANVPPAKAQESLKKATITRGANSVSFTITPGPGETDQFYQTHSNWRFYPGDDQPDAEGLSVNGLIGIETRFTFNVEVVKDAAYSGT